MNIDLSKIVMGIEGEPLNRTACGKDYSDKPLTLAFVVAHVLSVGVEDINAMENAAAQLTEIPNEQGLTSSMIRKRAYGAKIERGTLALRIAKAKDASSIELSADEIVMIREVAAPRLMPIVLLQLHDAIK